MKTPIEQLEQLAKSKRPVFKKEWSENDFKNVERAIMKYFAGKVFINHAPKNILFPYDLEGIENILGMPYTSSSSFAMMALDCNNNIKHPKNTDFYYSYVALDTNNQIYLVLQDIEENERFIKI